ncbi:DUF4267 domain-containing protein [Amycolatopsis thermalba]|uniref:DUF4267 domain-containing protein n=1 Tax=Amycolatopsis thermalba TaxID=944492 RepID=A0ABY4NYN3_9PSEU|nr:MULTISPECIES: DUF4267 domain-containing protein [Amycolatopsis]OXM75348.1 hypothetical protein CF166_01450 [Amycolatopsis sp. KNN50.9b]UQS25133.1 DUF4267 domain-containing protein [Amycolatopsis thermalba]
MLTPVAYGLAILLNLLLVFIGARFLFTPRAAAAGYGVPARTGGDPAYLTIKGLRDGGYGLVGLALLAFAGPHAEAWFMLVVALLPFGDTVVVLRNGGPKAVAFGVHFATAVVILLSAVLLFLV